VSGVTIYHAVDLGELVTERSRALPEVSLLHLMLGVDHSILRSRAIALGGEKHPKDTPPLEQEALFSVDWGRRVRWYLGFCEQLAGGFAKATFVAVVVYVYVEHPVALPGRVGGRLGVRWGEGHRS
jgi:hypothetical protein